MRAAHQGLPRLFKPSGSRERCAGCCACVAPARPHTPRSAATPYAAAVPAGVRGHRRAVDHRAAQLPRLPHAHRHSGCRRARRNHHGRQDAPRTTARTSPGNDGSCRSGAHRTGAGGPRGAGGCGRLRLVGCRLAGAVRGGAGQVCQGARARAWADSVREPSICALGGRVATARRGLSRSQSAGGVPISRCRPPHARSFARSSKCRT